jgi:hypothetical protein
MCTEIRAAVLLVLPDDVVTQKDLEDLAEDVLERTGADPRGDVDAQEAEDVE